MQKKYQDSIIGSGFIAKSFLKHEEFFNQFGMSKEDYLESLSFEVDPNIVCIITYSSYPLLHLVHKDS